MINTASHLAYVLKVKESEFETITNNIANYYYEKKFEKFKKDGTLKLDQYGVQQFRVINPSILRLKEIQKRILCNILLKLQIPDYAYGGIKRRDSIKNARVHQGRKFIFTTDLKSFFPSVKNEKVFEMFRTFNFSPTVSNILTKLTTYKYCLPQGTCTSPALANLVFIKTGYKLQQFAFDYKLKFTSFVDDLTFSSPTWFKSKIPEIIKTIQEDGFCISHCKTSYKTKDPTVTGIIVRNNNLTLPNHFYIRVKDSSLSPEQRKGLSNYIKRVETA